jgi:hypothetical protein
MLDNLERVIIYNKCKIARITFSGDKRGQNGKLIPLDYRNPNVIYRCDIGPSFPCRKCGESIHLDEKVLSPANVRIPLDESGHPHECSGKKN